MSENSRLKKVLIIAYYWGTRIPGLAKYLPEFGWQPIILTPPMNGTSNSRFRIIETPYRDALSFWKTLFRFNPDDDVRRQVKERLGVISRKSLMDFTLTRIGEIVNYPDSERGWKPFAVRIGRELLQKKDIDVMLSSSSPVTSHLIAKELKARHKIPWVADFRDLWSQNHNYSYSPIRKLADRRLELKTLIGADALATAAEPWAEKLQALHRGKLVYSVTHGFDPEIVNLPPANLAAKFTITHTGSIYPGKQDPLRFICALSSLISDGTMNPDDVAVGFYGSKLEWLDKAIEDYGLSSVAKQYGVVPWRTALEKQRESQLLLHLTWEGQEKAGYSGRLTEYLAALRPILATGSGNDMTEELLSETKAGIYGRTIEDIKDILSNLYSEYKSKGNISYSGDIEKINKYGHPETARRFADIFNHLTQNNRGFKE